MRKFRLFGNTLLLLVLWAGSAVSVCAQGMPAKELDELVEQVMSTFEVPGIAVAVVKDGAVIHSKGYGVSSLKSAKEVDEHTLFGIASNSKAFTAAALGILVDEGRLDWDDKVIDHIPEFQLYNSYVTEEFTIRDLLTHRSGLGLGAGDLMIFPDASNFTISELIHNLRYLKPVSGFRTKYDYDNLLYIVAGEVVARVSGNSWEEFVETRILQPLDMNRTAANYSRIQDRSNIIDAHAVIDDQLVEVDRYDLELTSAAGGLYSSVNDLSKWLIMLMNDGQYAKGEGEPLLSRSVIREKWTPQTIIPFRGSNSFNTHFTSYGLGWFLSDVSGHLQASHTGGLPGMVSQVTMLPELKLGIIVLTNQQSGSAFRSITNSILQAHLGMEKKDWVAHYAQRDAESREEARKITDKVWQDIEASLRDQKVEADHAAYTGTYKDNWFGHIVIAEYNDHLRFRSLRSPRLSGEMLFYKDNTFVVKWDDRSMEADAFAMFELDSEGKGAGLKMKAVSPLTDFSYDFHDLDFSRVPDR